MVTTTVALMVALTDTAVFGPAQGTLETVGNTLAKPTWQIEFVNRMKPVSVTHFSSGVNDKWPLKGP